MLIMELFLPCCCHLFCNDQELNSYIISIPKERGKKKELQCLFLSFGDRGGTWKKEKEKKDSF